MYPEILCLRLTDAALLHPLRRQRHPGGDVARRAHAGHPPEPPRPGLQRRRRRGQGNRKVARALRHGRPDPRRHSRGHGELQVGAASGFSTST